MTTFTPVPRRDAARTPSSAARGKHSAGHARHPTIDHYLTAGEMEPDDGASRTTAKRLAPPPRHIYARLG